jgi:hypothetical protein
MRKLKLDLDHLQVESFDATRNGTTLGTVAGNVIDPEYQDDGSTWCYGGGGVTGPTNQVCIGPTFCCNPTANTGCCPPVTVARTCPWSCEGTCYATCPVSCHPEQCMV